MCEVLDAVVSFSLGEKLPKATEPFVRFILKGGSHTGVNKERIVSKVVGLKWNRSEHGHDGYKKGRPCEIKCETRTKGGVAGWGASDASVKKVQKFHKDNQRYYHAFFTESGRIVYIVSMNWNDTTCKEKIISVLKNNKKNGKRTAPKTSFTHWKDSGYKLEYLNGDYYDLISRRIRKDFEEKGHVELV